MDASLSFAHPLQSTPRGILHTSLDTAAFEAILLRLQSVIDVAGFWNAIQSMLSEVVTNDASVLYLNARDFSKTGYIPRILATSRATKFLKWMRDPEPIVHESPGTKICQLSDVSFKGWHHIACLLFWDQAKLTSEIAIMRTAKQGAVTNEEIAALSRLHPHIEATLHRLIALEKRDRAPAARRSLHIASHSPSEGEALTRAESQLIHLLHAGLSNKEIATRLEKSVRTVKTQLTSIYRKYGVRSRARLLATMMGAAE